MTGVSATQLDEVLQQVVVAAGEAKECLPNGCMLQALLGQVVEIGKKKVEVVLLGCGNVGKSTVANSLLGNKHFLPCSKARMTGRLCRTHYGECDEYSFGDAQPLIIEKGRISKELVNNSTVLRRDQQQFRAQLRVHLQAWTPSAFLYPGVTLVDAPGLDQEKEHIDVLREYMQETTADQVVLLYIMDVKQGMRNPDREFLQLLKQSEWTTTSLRLLLVFNKCDTLAVAEGKHGEDEMDKDISQSEGETLSDDDLIEETVMEAENYCQPIVCRLPVGDWEHGQAMKAWNDMFAVVLSAIAAQKQFQWECCLNLVGRIISGLETALDDGQKLEKLRAEIEARKSSLANIKESKQKHISHRAEEIKSILEAKRGAHFQALQKRTLKYEDENISKAQEKEVDEEILNATVAMIQNDIQTSMAKSPALSQALDVFKHAARALPITLLLDTLLSVMLGKAVLLFTGITSLVVAGACGAILLGAPFAVIYTWRYHRSGTLVNDYYKQRRFDAIYNEVLSNTARYAEKELEVVVELLEKQIESDEKLIAELEEKDGGLDMRICKKIVDNLEEVVEKSKTALCHDEGGKAAPCDEQDDSSWEMVEDHCQHAQDRAVNLATSRSGEGQRAV